MTQTKAALLALLVAGTLVYGVFGVFRDADLQEGFLWDLDYYREAAARWHAGSDPYLEAGSQTGYYYAFSITPLVTRAFLDLRAELLYVALMVAAIAATVWLSLRAAQPAPGTAVLCALYALAFGGAEAIYTLASGNLAWLASLLAAGGLWAAAKGRWTLFYVLIGLASILKPYALALLLVPFILRKLSPLGAAIALLPLTLDALLSRALQPELVASRSRAVWLGVVEPLQLRYTVAGRLSRVLNDLGLDVTAATWIAVLVQLAICVGIILLLRDRRFETPALAFALAVVAAFAGVPRMAGYDAYLFAPAAFVAFHRSFEAASSKSVRVVAAVALGVGLLKEGLVVLPVLTFVMLAISRPHSGSPDRTSS